MIPGNVLVRTFFIKGLDYGTAFTIDVDGLQYLVTAKHLVAQCDQSLKIFWDKEWCSVQLKFVGATRGQVDVAVFAASIPLSPTYALPANTDSIYYGQDVYFLGFPFKLSGFNAVTGKRPLPFVKKGTLSHMFDSTNEERIFYIDAMNNEGFSGGPAVFTPGNTPLGDFKVFGVVSKFRTEQEPVMGVDGEPNGMYVSYNTGLMVVYDIQYALDLIKLNPIGVAIASP